ncbi:MAG: hypothetical protein ACPGN3_00390 [Opitutales bacterium]
MSEPSQITAPSDVDPPATAPTPAAHILPAPIFFTDLLEAPEKLEGEEIDALVELEIEQSSPFPIEQLTWGWIQLNEGKTILTFATTLEKAKACGVTDFEAAHLPILAPFAACDLDRERAAQVLYYGPNNDAIAIIYDANGTPTEVEAFALEDNASKDDYREHAQSLFSGTSSSRWEHIYLGEPQRDDDIGLNWPKFDTAEPAEDAEPSHTTELDSGAAWYVDLRDRDFKLQRQLELKQSQRIWKALTILAIIAVVMLCLEVVQWSARGYLDFQEITITQQGPMVDRLEQQTTFLHKMSDIEQSQMRPFAVLAILNENRPDKIHFLRAEAINAAEYEVQAQGNSVSEVNNYIASYQGNPAFESLEHKITSSRSGRVLFDIIIRIGQLPEVAALSPAEDSENADGEEESDS